MKKLIFIPLSAAVLFAFLLAGCLGKPDNIKPVSNFKVEKYLGSWYEIARFDYIHERGLNQVTAIYSLRSADELKVVNRGYDNEKSRWKESEGKAFFVQFVHSGIIKVDGNKASARWIMQEAAEGPAEFYYDNYAVYMDTLEKHGDQWFFASRDYHYMWLNTHPFPGDVFDLPAEGTNGI